MFVPSAITTISGSVPRRRRWRRIESPSEGLRAQRASTSKPLRDSTRAAPSITESPIASGAVPIRPRWGLRCALPQSWACAASLATSASTSATRSNRVKGKTGTSVSCPRRGLEETDQRRPREDDRLSPREGAALLVQDRRPPPPPRPAQGRPLRARRPCSSCARCGPARRFCACCSTATPSSTRRTRFTCATSRSTSTASGPSGR